LHLVVHNNNDLAQYNIVFGENAMNLRLKVEILRQYPTQCDLARDLKVSESLLSKIVRGRHVPSPELRRALAQKLRVSEGELFNDAK
jgi:transcriptional regulator with XRE-family HTH domain